MLRKKHILTIALIASIVCLTAIDTGLAQGRRGRDHRGGHERGYQHAPFMSELTETQQAELQELIQTMREDGASRDEIRDAVHAKLDEWGVELPEHPMIIDRLGDQLTDEQIAELEELVQTMKDEGANHKEIRDAVHSKLAEWGIDTPNRREHRKFRDFGDQLNEAQRQELHALAQQLKEDGASRQEIRDAVHAKLEEWGIECPEGHGARHERGRNRDPQRSNRTVRGVNHPNPFNPETTITYDLQQPSNVTVSIFNTQGQLIRTFDAGHQQAGSFQMKWNGKSDAGVAVPSGMYVYKIQAGSEEFTGRMLMMK